MIFDWYQVFNLDEFEATGLVSRTYSKVFDTLGQKDILVTKGNEVSVLFDDVLLTIGLNEKNPFVFEERAVYLDADNNVWVGVLVPEET